MEQEQNLEQRSQKIATPQHKAAILRLLKMDELQYNFMQWNQAVDYLNTYLNHVREDVAMLEGARIFWAWWRNHWNMRDEKFLTIHGRSPMQSVKWLNQLYAQYNSGAMLAKNLTPNSIVLHESYKSMAHVLAKTLTEKV